VLSLEAPTLDDVRRAVDRADPNWQWFEAFDERVELYDPLDEFDAALATIPDFPDLAYSEALEALADALDKSTGTAGRRVGEAGGIDDVRDRWRELHDDEPERAEDIAEQAAVHEVRDGMSRPEANRRAARTLETAGPRPPDTRDLSEQTAMDGRESEGQKIVELPRPPDEPPWEATTFGGNPGTAEDLEPLEDTAGAWGDRWMFVGTGPSVVCIPDNGRVEAPAAE